jgi:dGTPase
MLSAQVYDVMDATRAALRDAAPDSVDAVRQHPPLVGFSPDMALKSASLKRFLLQNLYRHPQVVETTQTAQQVVRELFAAYMADPAQMPRAHTDRFDQLESSPRTASKPPAKPERVVADYIAGMTDRFAAKEHERLNGRVAFPV